MDFIKKIFSSNKNVRTESNSSIELLNNKKIIEFLLSTIINDKYLSTPIYIHGISTEEQDSEFGDLYPLQYVWNEYETDEGHLGFSFSINGKVIGSMLEPLIPRTDLRFPEIRDEVMSVLSKVGKDALSQIIERSLLPPSKMLKNFEYSDMIHMNFKSSEN